MSARAAARHSTEDEELARALEESMRTAAEPPVPPDAHSTIGLNELFEHDYKHGAKADLWRAKLHALSQKYEAVRRVRGEGNCFYRSFWMSWVDRLLSGASQPFSGSRHPLLGDVHSAAWAGQVIVLSSGAAASLPEEQAAQVVALGAAFIERTRGLCAAFTSGGEPELLLAARRTPETLEALRWLRLMASAYVRAHADDFAPFTDGRPIEAFCAEHIERDEELADEPQLQALTQALRLGVRVEYLDSVSAAWSERCGPHRHVLRIPQADDTADAAPPPTLAACVLFRPGHYDMLRPRDWADPSLLEPDGETFVPPLPPATRDVSCGTCSLRQACCTLCARAVCVTDGCPVSHELCTLPEVLASDGLAAVCGDCIEPLPMASPPQDTTPQEATPSSSEPPTVVRRSASFAPQKLMRCSAGCGFLGFDRSPPLVDHTRACEHVPRSCPNKCGAIRVRGAMADHLSHECSNRRVLCHLGCGEMLQASEASGMSLKFEEGDVGHMRTCQKVQQACGCGLFVVRDKLAAHLDAYCRHRMVSCSEGCGEILRAMNLDAHRAKCMHAAVDCTWRCGARVVRREMPGHKQCCPQVYMRCPGCHQRVQRREAQAHWAICAALPVLCAACDELCLRGQLRAHETGKCLVLNPPREPSPERRFQCGLCLETEPVDNSFQPGEHRINPSSTRYTR